MSNYLALLRKSIFKENWKNSRKGFKVYAERSNKYIWTITGEKCNYVTLHIRHVRIISTEVFKSLNSLNPSFMKEMFNVKETSYNLRDSRLMYLPSFNKIMYVKNIFKYYCSHLWNHLPTDIKKCMDLDTFKTLIMSWNGPRC